MRILLSGTSNAIIANGLGTALQRDRRVTALTNASYGASGTVALGDHLPRLDLAAHDVCLIDYCVNEKDYLDQGVTTLDGVIGNIGNMVDAASRAGCLPVILILPTPARTALTRSLEEALADSFGACGVPVFNGYAYIDAFSRRHGIPVGDLFIDPRHIRRELAYFIGTQIVTSLASLDFGRLILKETGATYAPLTFIGHDRIGFQGQTARVDRRSRLFSRNLRAISPGSRLHIRHERPFMLSGITLNAARSWAMLSDRDTGRRVFQTSYAGLFSLRRDLTLISEPLNRQAASVTEILLSLHDHPQPLAGPDRPPMGLELSGLIIAEPDRPQPLAVLGLPGLGPHLDAAIDPAAEAEIARTLSPKETNP